MLKKIFVLLFLIFIIPFSTLAHTTLLSSTPAEGENLTEALKEAELVFGTRIEEGSTMTIEGENSSFEFDSIIVEGDTMSGAFSETLANGSYRILWNIIGEDGHPIEGEIAFGVTVEEEEAPAATETAEEPAEESAVPSEEAAADEEQPEEGGNLLVTILLVLAAVLVVYGIFKLLKKKK